MDNIDREHPEYTCQEGDVEEVPGPVRRRRADAGARLRVSGAAEQRAERCLPGAAGRVFYENYIGSIIDWYAATLLRREPVLVAEGANEAGRQFFNQFAEDCDLKGPAGGVLPAATGEHAGVRPELHRAGFSAVLRAGAESGGGGRRRGDRGHIWWSIRRTRSSTGATTSDGNLEWVVIRTSCLRQEKDHRQRMEARDALDLLRPGEFSDLQPTEGRSDRGRYELVDEGRHGLASQRRCRCFSCKVSEGLWLMNKAALLQLEHFNKSNALAWALTMGLFATPVVYSDREWNQIVGESYYIQLGPQDKFGWTEPEGNVYQIAADNLDRLKDEIYRVCYLMTQASGTQAAASVRNRESASSGTSASRRKCCGLTATR